MTSFQILILVTVIIIVLLAAGMIVSFIIEKKMNLINRIPKKEKRKVNGEIVVFNKKRVSVGAILEKVLIYGSLLIFALWTIIPFSIVLSTSMKTWQEANQITFSFFPKQYDFSGYTKAILYNSTPFDTMIPDLVRGFGNTLLFVVPTTLIGLLTSSFAGYAFAKINFKGKKLLFGILMVSMLIPGTIMIVPSYILYDALGLSATPFPIIVPGMFGAAACVFFMKQFFSGLPNDLIDAAKVDGLNHFQIFWRIIVPLSKPALLAQGILGFVGGYNDYFNPNIYLTEPKYYTLQISLRQYAGTMSQQINSVMAGCIIVLVPVLIIYCVAQKYFVEGIATTGMKL
ncbi:MAG: carbohydrate ABC transporter permease [Acholeplasmatales bacterium]|jgi:multiple sugar transport system permease protein|nr:carbohydrate ABC transporter permease [Acholeplasmatales bacterium]